MLINDLDKFIKDMDDDTINRLHQGTTVFNEEGIMPEESDGNNIDIEPITGLIDCLIGDISDVGEEGYDDEDRDKSDVQKQN